MKTRDKKELHGKNENELLKMLQDAKDYLSALKFEKVQNKLKNTSDISNTRKKIAILRTIMRQKELIKNV